MIKNALIGALFLSSYPVFACNAPELTAQVKMPEQKNIYKISIDGPVVVQSLPDASCDTAIHELYFNDKVKVSAFLNGFYAIEYKDEQGKSIQGWIPSDSVRNLQLTTTTEQPLLNDKTLLARLVKGNEKSCYPAFKRVFMQSDFPFDLWLLPEEEIHLTVQGILHQYVTAQVTYIRANSGQSDTMAVLQFDLDEGSLWQVEGQDKQLVKLNTDEKSVQQFQSCLLGSSGEVQGNESIESNQTQTSNNTELAPKQDSVKYVAEAGRTYFYELDSGEFIQTNIFIVQGDEVSTSTVFGSHTKVAYQSKNGRVYKGWVLSNHLSDYLPD